MVDFTSPGTPVLSSYERMVQLYNTKETAFFVNTIANTAEASSQFGEPGEYEIVCVSTVVVVNPPHQLVLYGGTTSGGGAPILGVIALPVGGIAEKRFKVLNKSQDITVRNVVTSGPVTVFIYRVE